MKGQPTDTFLMHVMNFHVMLLWYENEKWSALVVSVCLDGDTSADGRGDARFPLAMWNAWPRRQRAWDPGFDPARHTDKGCCGRPCTRPETEGEEECSARTDDKPRAPQRAPKPPSQNKPVSPRAPDRRG